MAVLIGLVLGEDATQIKLARFGCAVGLLAASALQR